MRAMVALCLEIAAAILGYSAGFGLTGSWVPSAAIAVVAAGLVGWWSYQHPPVRPEAAPRWLKVVSGVATVLALVQLARLAVFMVDPARVEYSFLPTSRWEVRHSCLTAYFVAARAIDTAPNVYADSLYTATDDDVTKPRKALTMGPFKVDVYEYPPPFLLLPRLVRLFTPDFFRMRMLWFALDGGFVLLGLLVVARLLGPVAGSRALLLSPLVWVAGPTLSTLQKGNVQAVVIAGAMLAMVLFERRRPALGGALLAFATVSKLYPGMLIVYLVARRQWRAVAWTAAFGLAFVLMTLLDTGWAPYAAFLDHLPGLVGGEAFPAFRNPAAKAINLSIPGIVFKLGLFGFPGMTFAVAKAVGWVYTIALVGLSIWAGRRFLRDGEKPLVWLAILTLATLRSPFLPQTYAVFPPLWLLTLVAAHRGPTARTLAGVLGVWVALNIYWPIDWPMDPRWVAAGTMIPQAVTVALALVALRFRIVAEEQRVTPVAPSVELAPVSA